MQGAFGAPPGRRRPMINITPLIDVMFLLLIFFMVSSTFREHLGIDVELPYAASATEQEHSPYEIVLLAPGEIMVGERSLALRDELHQHLQALIAEEPDAVFTLRAAGPASFQEVVEVIDVAREAGGKRLVILTE